MDKFKELSNEYRRLLDRVKPHLGDHPDEFEYYIETLLLRIWASNGLYSEDYSKAIEAVSGRSLGAEQILKAMIDGTAKQADPGIPGFFASLVDSDFKEGNGDTKSFVEELKTFLVGGAFINGDFTVEESAEVSAEIKRLMTYAISKGVKVEYSSGRIREKTTPLNDKSYERAETRALDDSMFFGALAEGFLKPASLKRDELSGYSGQFTPSSGESTSQNKTEDASKAVTAVEDERTMEELMEDLDGLVGLESIKKDIRSLMNFIEITRLRQERGLSVPTISYHLVFTGNPGTGKTTVARLVAGLYHRIGILPKGQLVEVDRGRLVAGYTGQTAIKTLDVIDQALGGVLFIDEAYALINDDQDSFGKEAVETILKAMEDHRDELVVIVAGYTELMHKFIESNPGFKSRFSKYFEFPDYTGRELMEIFLRFCKGNGYNLKRSAEKYLQDKFEEMYENRDRHFGNGRTVRNIFEKAIHSQADRLAACTDDVSVEELQELIESDIEKAVADYRSSISISN